MQLRFRNGAEKTKTLDYYLLLEIQFLMHLYMLGALWAIFFLRRTIVVQDRENASDGAPESLVFTPHALETTSLTQGLGEIKLQSENFKIKEVNRRVFSKNSIFFVYKIQTMHILFMHILTEIKTFVFACINFPVHVWYLLTAMPLSFYKKKILNFSETKNSWAYKSYLKWSAFGVKKPSRFLRITEKREVFFVLR